MKPLILLLLPVAVALAGCSGPTSTDEKTSPRRTEVDEAEVRANLEKLSPEDRKKAEAQRWCAVETENRLGGMGVPAKVEVEGQTVFLCCKSCSKRALADAEKTLATVKKLRARAAEAAKE